MSESDKFVCLQCYRGDVLLYCWRKTHCQITAYPYRHNLTLYQYSSIVDKEDHVLFVLLLHFMLFFCIVLFFQLTYWF